jgi:hypothetical protein
MVTPARADTAAAAPVVFIMSRRDRPLFFFVLMSFILSLVQYLEATDLSVYHRDLRGRLQINKRSNLRCGTRFGDVSGGTQNSLIADDLQSYFLRSVN